MIAVGDLVDRGPKNLEVLNFFTDNIGKSVFTVKGNHDEMCEMFLANDYGLKTGYFRVDGSLRHRNGSDWTDRHVRNKDQALEIVSFFEKLPYVIVVGRNTPDRYNVVHTEFIRTHPKPKYVRSFFGDIVDPLQKFNGKVTDAMIDCWPIENCMKNAAIYSTSNTSFTWQRNILDIALNGKQQQPGKMSITYSGHNSINAGVPGKKQQKIILDTGAGYLHFISDTSQCHLSMIDHKSGVVYQVGKDMSVRETTVDLEWVERIEKLSTESYNTQLARRKKT